MEAGVESVIHIEDQDGDLLVDEKITASSFQLEEVPMGTESITITLVTCREGHESFKYRLTAALIAIV